MTAARTTCAAGALAGALLLSGCGMFGSREPPRPCPAAGILPDASSLTLFRDGAGRDLSDVVVTGQLVNVDMQCRYDRTGMTADLRVLVSATRGQADTTRVHDIEYFVAIADPQRNILSKERFVIRFEFRDQPRINRIDELEPRIPLSDLNQGPGYAILVGFQLTPEQLEYNRTRGGGT
jgi:hypothetical protein